MTVEEEYVVLVDQEGRPIGQAPKRTVHGPRTPRHLGFSCYGFNAAGRLLVTQRAADKATFPGVWSNTTCGHPGPGEAVEHAVLRRLRSELDVLADDVTLVLPDFSYRVSAHGIEENELCPVLTCRVAADPVPDAAEVQAWEWWHWDRFLAATADPSTNLSLWARLQAPLLDSFVRDHFL